MVSEKSSDHRRSNEVDSELQAERPRLAGRLKTPMRLDRPETEVSINMTPPAVFQKKSLDEVDGVDKYSVLLKSPRSDKYEDKTKKCSKRISELSDMLEQVRKDKEKLLNSSSGNSSLNCSKTKQNFKKSDEKILKIRREKERNKPPPALEDFTKR